jgi:hypothetical protein
VVVGKLWRVLSEFSELCAPTGFAPLVSKLLADALNQGCHRGYVPVLLLQLLTNRYRD